jgi:hypothetical protein
MSIVGLRTAVQEFCGILPEFVLYWISLAVASWMWSIIWEDNRLKPYSTGFRKFFYFYFATFYATTGLSVTPAGGEQCDFVGIF